MRTLVLPLVILVLTGFLSGCGNDEDYLYSFEYTTPIPDPLHDSTIGPSYEFGMMKATVNSTLWHADTVWALVSGGTLMIKGQRDSTNLQINLISTIEQDYALGQGQSSAVYFDGSTTYYYFSGTVSLNSVDIDNKYLAGTFFFDASNLYGDTKTITGGEFLNVIYYGTIYNN
ncbi:MAG: hypothetical protein KJ607_11520, partial [Bacteroidetes bacterium]|nr:hypothetical protein [Bacteroidota bacterium]